jgi:glycosyltransferase involved in cell wall biosynthesis
MTSPPRIIYVQYTNPASYPPLEHSSRILADREWQVLFLGTGAAGADDLKLPAHPNIQVRKWRFQSAGFLQKLHYVAFNVWVLLTALLWRPKWIYASDLLSCPAALVLKKLGFRVLYHEHDAPIEQEVRGQKSDISSQSSVVSHFQRFLLWTRKKVARSVDVCVIPNEKRMERFKQTTGREGPTFCVWNCPLRAEALPEPQKASDKFIVFYHGSIVPSRLPLEVVDALATLPENVVLEFAGYETVGHAGYASELLNHAKSKGIAQRIRYHGPVRYRTELLDLCRRAHVGLALMPLNSNDPNEETMTGASNKPFDYLGCGLALAVSNLPAWREIFVESGYGRACECSDPAALIVTLRWFLEHPNETLEMAARGRARLLQEWNYETQFARLLVQLDR